MAGLLDYPALYTSAERDEEARFLNYIDHAVRDRMPGWQLDGVRTGTGPFDRVQLSFIHAPSGMTKFVMLDPEAVRRAVLDSAEAAATAIASRLEGIDDLDAIEVRLGELAKENAETRGALDDQGDYFTAKESLRRADEALAAAWTAIQIAKHRLRAGGTH